MPATPPPPYPPRPLSPGVPVPPARRRRPLRWLVIGLAAIPVSMVLFVGTVVALVWRQSTHSSGPPPALETPLDIPPLLEPRIASDGTKEFDLRFTTGTTELMPGRHTPTWGLNGTYLGPTVRATRGDRVRMLVANGADEATTLHWHGMHLPAEMDGGPHQMIEPGTTWRPEWVVDQPAATLWYHPHLHEATAEHVYRGAAGLFLLDDERSATIGLPNRYGVDDVPLVLQDKSIGEDGSLLATTRFPSDTGIVGDQVFVNGTWGPVFEAATTRVRFRVLNGSNARPYHLGFADGRSYQVVATDSGLLPEPVTTERLMLVPGERAEIVVDVRPGDDVVLRSFPSDVGSGFMIERGVGAGDTFDLLRITAADRLEASPSVPPELEPRVVPDDVAEHRDLRFSGTNINGRKYDHHRIDQTIAVDTTEEWTVRAADDGYHIFHVHDTRFTVVAVDGQAPPPLLAGWKDTLWLEPGRVFTLRLRFEDYADPETPYMYHCHVLAHEDDGMMGQLVVR